LIGCSRLAFMTANNDPLGVEFCLSVSRGRTREEGPLVSASTPNWLSPESRYSKRRPSPPGMSTRDGGVIHRSLSRQRRPENLQIVISVTDGLGRSWQYPHSS
jgi:hypothetical protein